MIFDSTIEQETPSLMENFKNFHYIHQEAAYLLTHPFPQFNHHKNLHKKTPSFLKINQPWISKKYKRIHETERWKTMCQTTRKIYGRIFLTFRFLGFVLMYRWGIFWREAFGEKLYEFLNSLDSLQRWVKLIILRNLNSIFDDGAKRFLWREIGDLGF